MNYKFKLAVVIVNYNVKYFLEQALITVLKASENLNVNIIIVDNNSVDGSVQMLQEKFPTITLILNKENVGFSKANNQGISIANSEYILLLNPDTVLQEDTLQKCITFMETHSGAGALGVKMIDGKGAYLPESKRGLPTPEVAFYKLFGFSKLFPKSKIFGKYHLTYLDKNLTHEVEVLSGAFMMIRKETLDKSGLLDETFFMYGEDVDLSYRITEAGYKNYYFADTSIIHYKGESTKKSSIKYIFTFYQAMLIFARKHFSGKKANALSIIVNFGIYLKIAFELTKQRIKILSPFIADIALTWLIMWPISDYWGKHIKPEYTLFPMNFYFVILPCHCLFWVINTYFSGGYDKPFNLIKTMRGILFSTMFISAVSNFIEQIRYSRGLIIVGAIVVFVVSVTTKYIFHYLKHKNFDINFKKPKNALLLGSYAECLRVNELIKKSNASIKVLGYLNEKNANDPKMPFLGNYSQFNEVINYFKTEEVLFCSKDLKSKTIINYMLLCENSKVDFKIIPHETDYIIGSNSKNSQGNIYSIDIVFNILRVEQKRNKRLIDIIFTSIFFITAPLIVLFQHKKIHFLRNLFVVLFGNKTWVSIPENSKLKLAGIKQGIIPCCKKEILMEDSTYEQEIDYAKNFTIYKDIDIILKNLSNLGGR